ncbi:MAG TPA: hypothetical protein VLG27_01870 [Candidatus Saccharimonadia bacterium]|nr:hypothetical protein [Candidatus Saccharimonadia bacterium]
MNWSNFLAGAFGLLAVIIGARLTYVNQQNIKLREGLNKEKQKTYIALLEFLSELEDNAASADQDQVATELKKYFKQILYYGSPGVLKALGDYMQFFYTEYDESRDFKTDQTNLFQYKLYGELVVQVRKDLGHVKWLETESWLDVIRLKIKDINEYIPEKGRGYRGEGTKPSMLLNKKKRM